VPSRHRRSKEIAAGEDESVYWDPFDRAIARDPYPVYRRLRAQVLPGQGPAHAPGVLEFGVQQFGHPR
jgi:hypothetical protein